MTRWFGGAVLAALVLVGLATLLGRGPATGFGLVGPAAGEERTPGYSARDTRLVQTGSDGRPLYTLVAREMRQDMASQDVTATDLTLDYAPADDGADPVAMPWELTARHGRLPGGTLVIALDGDVRLTGTPAGSRSPVRLETEAMEFDINAQRARTDLPVTVDWGATRVTARGLTADLKRGTVRLESRVNGRFVP